MKTAYFIAILILSVCLAFLTGCGDNSSAKLRGGSIVVALPKGQKLVNATWKDTSLWYLTRPMRDGEPAETSTFQEKSNYGYLEGKVVFNETK